MAYRTAFAWNLRGCFHARRSLLTVALGAVVGTSGCVSTKSSDPTFGASESQESAKAATAAFSPAAIGASVGKSFKAGTDKVASAFKSKPDPEPMVERPISWWPFKKDDGPGADFYVALARVHEQSSSFDSAIDQYKKALDIDPEHGPALVGYAHVLDRQGQKVKATELYLRAVKAHPEDASIANDLGLCYARQGKFEEAIEYLSKAIELQPQRELYRNNIATVLVETGRAEEAVTQIAAVYGEPIAHYNVGVLLKQQGQRQAAMDQFSQAIALDPGLSQAREWLAQLTGDEEPREQLASAQYVQPTAHSAEERAESNDLPVVVARPAGAVTIKPSPRVAMRPATPHNDTAAPAARAPEAAAVPASPPAAAPIAMPVQSPPPQAASPPVLPLPAVDSAYTPPGRY